MLFQAISTDRGPTVPHSVSSFFGMACRNGVFGIGCHPGDIDRAIATNCGLGTKPAFDAVALSVLLIAEPDLLDARVSVITMPLDITAIVRKIIPRRNFDI